MSGKSRDISRCSKPDVLPSVILITLDAFNYELFVSNLENLPHMRELKDNSVFFENTFSIGPSTPFSFPGIIGGVYPYHFGIGIDKNVKTIDSVLKDYGYPAERIGVMGYGEYRPVADNATEANKGKNRRVEVYLVPRGAIVPGSADAGWGLKDSALAFARIVR